MAHYALVPHRDFPSSAIQSIAVEASRGSAGRLELGYRASGAVERVRWPDWKGVEPADGLWEHSCFEAFVGTAGNPAYAELNFSTSGQWGAYAFTGYRQGMARIDNVLVGGGRTFGDGIVEVRRTVDLPDWVDVGTWALGLSAVIETLNDEKSYWALAHPEGAPDFHNAICFAARLAAPEPA